MTLPRRPLIVAVLLFSVLPSILGAAQEKRQKQSSQPRQSAPPIRLVLPSGPPQVMFFQVTVSESSKAEVEELFRREVLPYVLKSPKILAIKTYAKLIGENFTYMVEVDLKPGVPLTYGTVFEVLSNGKTAEQTFATINRLASFFHESTSSVVLYRPDLSISRSSGLGYRSPAAEKGAQ
jgi:hypothetical protein